MGKEIYDLYKIPRKAALLLKNKKLRMQTFKKIVSKYDINSYGFGERMEHKVIERKYLDEELRQALGYLTFCVTDKKCSTGSYGAKHGAERITINGNKCYVPNGIMMISVLMCDGKVKQYDGLNGVINIKEPRLCGYHSFYGCGRLIRPTRKSKCSICRSMSYDKIPKSQVSTHRRYFDDIVATSLTQFPPKTDIIGIIKKIKCC